jgi:acyl-CoA thioesterase-1
MIKLSTLLVSLSLVVLTACGGGSDPKEPAVIMVYGDSLTHNNGVWVTPSEHWVERLKSAITAEKLDAERSVTVVNEGLAGENSLDALDRLPGALTAHKPTHVVLLHGTNDIPPFCPECAEIITRPYLEAMAKVAKESGAEVIMGEFTLKAYGGAVAGAYTAAYQTAARNSESTYVNLVTNIPFDGTNYWFDGIHFTNDSQEAIKNNLSSVLFPMLR